MKNDRKVECKYCHKEMTLAPELVQGPGDPEEPYNRWYECYICGARSPIAQTEDAAYAAATCRPENKPLTREQIQAMDEYSPVWSVNLKRIGGEGHFISVQPAYVARRYIKHDWMWKEFIAFAERPTLADIEVARAARNRANV